LTHSMAKFRDQKRYLPQKQSNSMGKMVYLGQVSRGSGVDGPGGLSSVLTKGRKSCRKRRLQLSQSLQQQQMRQKAAVAATDTMEVATVVAKSDADGQKATMVAAEAAQEAIKR
jgi:hypothetical protein